MEDLNKLITLYNHYSEQATNSLKNVGVSQEELNRLVNNALYLSDKIDEIFEETKETLTPSPVHVKKNGEG